VISESIEVIQEEDDPKLADLKRLLRIWGDSCRGKIIPSTLKYPSECVYTKLIQNNSRVFKNNDYWVLVEIDKVVMSMPNTDPRCYKTIIQLQYAFPRLSRDERYKRAGLIQPTYYKYLRLGHFFIKNSLIRKGIKV